MLRPPAPPPALRTGEAALLVILCLGLSAPPAGAADPPDFATEVRPILAGHCFKCHGPDDTTRESGLRLDTARGATSPADSGEPAVIPGDPDQSVLIHRITSDDEAVLMPPPSAKRPLSSTQIDILRRWIAAGGEFEPHWAFVPPRRPQPPEVRGRDRVLNPVDRFILARLEAEGLTLNPEADRATLARRVSLDLCGLPPTTEQAAAFLADESPEAYERFVDELLASPRYGERWARLWLDLARYADTNGYEKDRVRSVWPWRDWVIRTLNDDLPFDEFTIEQLAGDLLPGATTDQRVATGFHRNTMLNEEGGIDPLEFRFHAMTDRVGTTGAVWLGLTLNCAQCHTHKFDPIPQREYYALLACLNNADEVKLPAPDDVVAARRSEIEAELVRREAALPGEFPLDPADGREGQPDSARREAHLERRFQEWLKARSAEAIDWRTAAPTGMSTNLAYLELLPDGSVLASGDQAKREEYTCTLSGDFAGARALRLEVLPHPSLPRGGPGRTDYEGPEGDFFLSEITVTPDANGSPQPLTLQDASDSFARLGIGGGESGARLALDGDFQTGWSTSGREGEAHQAVFRFSTPVPEARTLTIHMVFERHYAAALGRFRFSLTNDERPATATGHSAEIEQWLAAAPEQRTPEAVAALRREFLNTAAELAPAREKISELRKSRPEEPTALVFRERPPENPRTTFVHRRGEFLQPTDPVAPGVLSILHAAPVGEPLNRLAFARWLVSRENPLVARVVVNRHWAALFGPGLVRTTQDFGYQGAAPTHPELLDWLAVEFMQDWSVKRLHRLLVTSAVYRQSSSGTPDAVARDPENRLLARGPRFRIEAEIVRDAALAASSLLSDKLYGPSVFPAQPASITTEGAYGALEWKTSTGEDAHRRGLYTFMKRTAPFAMFATFDGPSGEACLVRREKSNTPLQALTMLNDQVLVEAARALGRSAAAEAGRGQDAAAWTFQQCLGRPPGPREHERLRAFAEAARSRYAAQPELAAQFAGLPAGEAVEPAVWTALARAVLNLDEFVTRE